MTDQFSAEPSTGKEGVQDVSLDTSATAGQDAPPAPDDGAAADAASMPDVTVTPAPATGAQRDAAVTPSQASVDTVTAASTAPATAAPLLTGQAGATIPVADPNTPVMNFTADCWLEIADAVGKKLFSGMQRKDGNLNLTGQTPYKLGIGAPAAVQAQFQGRPVDLSRFIGTNQVVRLTVNAEQSPAR